MSPDWQPLTQLNGNAPRTESITKIGDSTQYSMYTVQYVQCTEEMSRYKNQYYRKTWQQILFLYLTEAHKITTESFIRMKNLTNSKYTEIKVR